MDKATKKKAIPQPTTPEGNMAQQLYYELEELRYIIDKLAEKLDVLSGDAKLLTNNIENKNVCGTTPRPRLSLEALSHRIIVAPEYEGTAVTLYFDEVPTDDVILTTLEKSGEWEPEINEFEIENQYFRDNKWEVTLILY